MKRNTVVSSFVASIAAAIAIAAACAPDGRADAGPPATASQQRTPAGGNLWRESTGQAPAAGAPNTGSLAPLIKQLKPAVVNISSTTVMKNPHRGLRRPPGGGGGGDEGGGGGDDLLERFFGQREMPQEFKGTSLGSGFIINDEGYVLTNNHVVKDATDIKVRTSEGKEFEGKVVGRDRVTDVALVKLQDLKGKLPTVALGDSDALRAGRLRARHRQPARPPRVRDPRHRLREGRAASRRAPTTTSCRRTRPSTRATAADRSST